jgi:hypothetical protein
LQFGGAANITPNQESVKEIQVVSSSFSAEDGRNSGAQIKVVSQNGTNEYHGSLLFNITIRGGTPLTVFWCSKRKRRNHCSHGLFLRNVLKIVSSNTAEV